MDVASTPAVAAMVEEWRAFRADALARPAAVRAVLFALLFAAAAALLFAGSSAGAGFAADPDGGRRVLLRTAALVCLAAVVIMTGTAFPAMERRALLAVAGASGGSVRAQIFHVLARQALRVLAPLALGTLAFCLGVGVADPWALLFGVELAVVFLGVALGLLALFLRLWLDFAARAEGTMLRLAGSLHRIAYLTSGSAWAAAVWFFMRPRIGDALVSGVVMAGALLLLGLNRTGQMDRSVLERIAPRPRR